MLKMSASILIIKPFNAQYNGFKTRAQWVFKIVQTMHVQLPGCIFVGQPAEFRREIHKRHGIRVFKKHFTTQHRFLF